MSKKINLAERISEMVNDDAARTYIREHTLYPAVLLSGTRIGAEEKVRPLQARMGGNPQFIALVSRKSYCLSEVPCCNV